MPRPSKPTGPVRFHPRRTGRATACLVVLGLALGACRDPQLPTGEPTSSPSEQAASTPGPAADVPDPRDAVLATVAADLIATLVDALGGFESLAQAPSLEDARPTVLRLRAVLAADPRWQDVDGDGAPDDLGVRPLLPGPNSSREETIDYGDAFTAILTAARDAGPEGAPLVDVLRDPIVSDLGSWQRDTAGMLGGIEDAITGVRSVEQAEQAVNELAGEGPRALAWALLAADAPDLETLQAYGERGAVHVGLMLDAVREVVS